MTSVDDMPEPTPPANSADILGDTIETLELTVRSARRCAYDLRHAADIMGLNAMTGPDRDKEMAKMFRERSGHYIGLFQSGNSMKDYRHALHHTIWELESRVEKLRAILAEHKIEDPTVVF